MDCTLLFISFLPPSPSTHPICTKTLPPSFSPYLMQQIPEYPCSDCLLSLYHEIIPNNYGPDLTLTLFLLVFTSCLTILHYIQLQWQYLSFYFPLFGFITNYSLLLLQVSPSLLHKKLYLQTRSFQKLLRNKPYLIGISVFWSSKVVLVITFCKKEQEKKCVE